MKSVAVVILNWNGVGYLRQFLPSVVSSLPAYARVVIVDNGSTDDSVGFIANTYPQIQQIVLSQNWGFAEGYNKGLAQIEADYYILLNSDIEVKDSWVEPIYNYMELHPEVGAAQPTIKSWYLRDHFEHAGAAGGYIDYLGYPFCRGRLMHVLEQDCGQYDQVRSIFWATGAALMIRAHLYREIGGLDGRFFAHMEEIDLCWRLKNRGHTIVCVPQSKLYHIGGGTLPKSNPRKSYLNFRNNLWMIYKNLPPSESQKILRIRTILDGIAALQFLITGHYSQARAVYRAHRDFRRTKMDFTADRDYNESCRTSATTHPELYDRSLLWQFYIRRVRRYSDLHHQL